MIRPHVVLLEEGGEPVGPRGRPARERPLAHAARLRDVVQSACALAHSRLRRAALPGLERGQAHRRGQGLAQAQRGRCREDQDAPARVERLRRRPPGCSLAPTRALPQASDTLAVGRAGLPRGVPRRPLEGTTTARPQVRAPPREELRRRGRSRAAAIQARARPALRGQFKLYQRTYQAMLGVGFSRDELNRRLAEPCTDRGWFRGYVLYLRDKPVAFWHGNVYAGSSGSARQGSTPPSPTTPRDVPAHAAHRGPLRRRGRTHARLRLRRRRYKRHFGDGSWLEEETSRLRAQGRGLAINRSTGLGGRPPSVAPLPPARLPAPCAAAAHRKPTGLPRSFRQRAHAPAPSRGCRPGRRPGRLPRAQQVAPSEMIVDGARRVDPPTVRKRTERVHPGHNPALRA